MINTKKVIFNALYQEEASVSNEDVQKAVEDKIYLIHGYVNENKEQIKFLLQS